MLKKEKGSYNSTIITMKYIYRPFRDLFLQLFPISINQSEYRYGFLIHPRDEKDVQTKYPFLKYVPKRCIRFFTRWYWPIVVTKITGLKDSTTDENIDGYILSIPLITEQILHNRKLAVKRIRQAIILAKRMGIKIIGLGALTASVTKGGEDVLDIPGIWVTTGHAYTGYNVTRNLFYLEKKLNIDKDTETIGIVGAAGSIGSISANIIVRNGYKKLLLVDVQRKSDRVEELADELKNLYPETHIDIRYDIGAIKDADFIIAATNTPEALITNAVLKPGAVVIDDAQPSDVAFEVLERDDVMAIEAGVVSTPGICSNFNLGLKDPFDNFCCMAEVLILASHKWKSNFVIKRTTLKFVDTIAEMGKPLNFTVAKFQNRKESISEEKLNVIARVREQNKK